MLFTTVCIKKPPEGPTAALTAAEEAHSDCSISGPLFHSNLQRLYDHHASWWCSGSAFKKFWIWTPQCSDQCIRGLGIILSDQPRNNRVNPSFEIHLPGICTLKFQLMSTCWKSLLCLRDDSDVSPEVRMREFSTKSERCVQGELLICSLVSVCDQYLDLSVKIFTLKFKCLQYNIYLYIIDH